MSRSRPINTQLGHGATWSSNITWVVMMHCDNRMNVTQATAIARYGPGPDPLVGTRTVRVAPFDDLQEVLNLLMLEAAASVSDQLTLFPPE